MHSTKSPHAESAQNKRLNFSVSSSFLHLSDQEFGHSHSDYDVLHPGRKKMKKLSLLHGRHLGLDGEAQHAKSGLHFFCAASITFVTKAATSCSRRRIAACECRRAAEKALAKGDTCFSCRFCTCQRLKIGIAPPAYLTRSEIGTASPAPLQNHQQTMHRLP